MTVTLQTESDKKNVSNENTTPNYKEGGWGWIVVIAVSYCFGILYGMVNNYALIYNKFTIVYNGTHNHIIYAAWTGSLSYAIQCVLCIIGSILVDLFNPRIIGVIGGLISAVSLYISALINEIEYYLLTYGFFLAIGQALLLASTLAILPHYFSKKLSLANGITTASAAACCSILPPLTYYILEEYDLKHSFYLLALLNVIASLCCLTYRPIIITKSTNIKDRIKKSFGFDVLRNKKYLIWCGATFIGVLGYIIPIVIIDHHSETVFPEYNPVILNIVFGVASGFGAIFFGVIGDLTKFNRVHYHTFAYLIYGIVQILIPFAVNFYVLIIHCTILGLMDGVILCFIVPISCDLVKSSKLSNQATGYYHLVMGPMAIVGPTIAGVLYEINHDYSLAFYISGASCIFSGMILVVFILLPELSKHRKKIEIEMKERSPALLVFEFVV